MDGSPANLAHVQLLLNNGQATPVATTNTLTTGGTVIRVAPQSALTASSFYCIFIANSVLNDVNALPLVNGFNTCFTTGTTSNTLPPTVTGVAPPDTTTGIGTNALLRITFSTLINPITVNGTTVHLSGGAFSLVPASIATSDTLSFTIAPQAFLPANTLMTLAHFRSARI